MELLLYNKINAVSLTLAAAMYTIAVGVSSRNKALFGLTILAGFFFALSHGFVSGQSTPRHIFSVIPLWGIGTVFLFHMLERYNRHVVDRTPFLEFT
jgi:hypothetical protein